LPAAGKVWHHNPPANPNEGINSNGVRVDTGIQPGQEVGVYYGTCDSSIYGRQHTCSSLLRFILTLVKTFLCWLIRSYSTINRGTVDPMICKLIVHDETREKALTKLVDSLKRYQIAGVATNIDFLVRCAEHDTFKRAGGINTGFLDDYMEEVLPTEETGATPSLGIAVGVFAALLKLEGRIGILNLQATRQTQPSPWNSLSGSWIMGGKLKRRLQLSDGTSVICTGMRDGSYELEVLHDDGNSNTFHVDGTLSSDKQMEVIINHTQRITVTTAIEEFDGGLIQICMWPQSPPLTWNDDYFWEVSVVNPMVPSSLASPGASIPGQGTVKSPMPGKISRINFAVGDFVEEGEVLILMEAMKMEHPIHAPSSGIVSSLPFGVNDVVADGVVLAVVENEQAEQQAV
jgi:3-methylcrotonyl-CoA carboxylase alpha subunit